MPEEVSSSSAARWWTSPWWLRRAMDAEGPRVVRQSCCGEGSGRRCDPARGKQRKRYDDRGARGQLLVSEFVGGRGVDCGDLSARARGSGAAGWMP